MMANTIKYTITFLTAAYFLLAGAGYNVVNYCCKSCAEVGIEVVTNNSCNDVHHHTHSTRCNHQNEDISCKDLNHQTNGCHFLRLNIDTPSIQATPGLSVNTINSIVLFYNILNLLKEMPELANQSIIHPPNSYFCTTGRDLITLHAAYLI